MSIVKQLHPANQFEIADDSSPLVRPGIHQVQLHHFETAMMFRGKAPKLVLWFSITSYGDDFGKQIPRYYNVTRVIGKPQKGGRFKVGKKSDFLREYFTLFHYDGGRMDRLPMTRFDGVSIQVEIETVTHARGRIIPKPLQYSKVSRLIKVVAGK